MAKKKLIERIAAVNGLGNSEPANAADIKKFEKILGVTLPELLRECLLTANGGDWLFGRFIKTPFVPALENEMEKEELWKYIVSDLKAKDISLPESNLILPFMDDYGEGIDCLDYRNGKNPKVVWCGYFEGPDRLEIHANNFESWVLESLKLAEQKAKAETIEIEIPVSFPIKPGPVDIREFRNHDILFEFVDIKLLAADERQSSPNETILKLFETEGQALAFALFRCDGENIRKANQEDIYWEVKSAELYSGNEPVAGKGSGSLGLSSQLLGKDGLSMVGIDWLGFDARGLNDTKLKLIVEIAGYERRAKSS